MQSNKPTKGLPIFCDDENIRDRSLIVYTYFVNISGLRHSNDGVRIFQQKNINIAHMEKILKISRSTIKKYIEQLEYRGLIVFTPDYYEDRSLPFNERWKIRNKNKHCYYEIPRPIYYRKIPKETTKELLERLEIDELTYKVYMTLVNYQEAAALNGHKEKRFTFQDLRIILGKKDTGGEINTRLEKALVTLRSFGLIDFDYIMGCNSKGGQIPIFILKQANFYVDYDIRGTGNIKSTHEEMDKEDRDTTIDLNESSSVDLISELEDICSKFLFSGARTSIKQLIEKGYNQGLIAFAIKEKGIDTINDYYKKTNKNGLGFLFVKDCEYLRDRMDYQTILKNREIENEEKKKIAQSIKDQIEGKNKITIKYDPNYVACSSKKRKTKPIDLDSIV